MRVTTKGQVTIPLAIRQELGIEPYSEVEFRKAKDGSYQLVKVSSDRPESRFSKIRGTATVKMSTDEIMALTRD